MLQKTEKKSKSQPVETVAERVKLRRQKVDDEDLYDMSQLERYEELNNRKRIKNLDPKQIINQNSNIISKNKTWKQFIQIKK